MPYSEKARKFFNLCNSPAGRKKARGKCPTMNDSKKLANEANRYAKKHLN